MLWHLLGARHQTWDLSEKASHLICVTIFHLKDDGAKLSELRNVPKASEPQRAGRGRMEFGVESGSLTPGFSVDHTPQESSLWERQACVGANGCPMYCCLAWVADIGVFFLLVLFKLCKYVFTHTHMHAHTLLTSKYCTSTT